MTPIPALDPTKRPHPLWGTILRVGFYIATAFVSLQLWLLILSIFGFVVETTIGIFATALTANLLTMRIFDRRPLADIGLGTGGGAGQNFGIGVILGGAAPAIMLVLPLLAGSAHLEPKAGGALSWGSLLVYMTALVFGAAGEEILFRGYAFQLLIEKIGPFATVLPVGVLFGLAHSSNPNATTLSVINTALWGVLLGFAFLRSRDLWLPIGLHYGWNAVLPLFGVNLSGLTIDVTRYVYRWNLSNLWSGGTYGPEGGLLTTVFVSLLFLAILRVPVRPQTAVIARVLNEPDLPL